jgi:ribosomal protein S18 acetylase RimI-like enzyme
MKFADYRISRVISKDSVPFDLLLLADETIEAIERYIHDCDVYVAKEGDQSLPVAVFALYKISDAVVEIKNIAVLESLQGQGLGSHLIKELKRIATMNKYETVIVGTPFCSFRQLHFYEKNGFTRYGMRKGFYLMYYPETIIENGIMLNDMVMLKLDL